MATSGSEASACQIEFPPSVRQAPAQPNHAASSLRLVRADSQQPLRRSTRVSIARRCTANYAGPCHREDAVAELGLIGGGGARQGWSLGGDSWRLLVLLCGKAKGCQNPTVCSVHRESHCRNPFGLHSPARRSIFVCRDRSVLACRLIPGMTLPDVCSFGGRGRGGGDVAAPAATCQPLVPPAGVPAALQEAFRGRRCRRRTA